jgi:hypothetical protein
MTGTGNEFSQGSDRGDQRMFGLAAKADIPSSKARTDIRPQGRVFRF